MQDTLTGIFQQKERPTNKKMPDNTALTPRHLTWFILEASKHHPDDIIVVEQPNGPTLELTAAELVGKAILTLIDLGEIPNYYGPQAATN